MLRTLLTPVIAAIAAYFLEQAWWIRALEGAAVGAIAFVVIPAAINSVAERGNIASLRVDCFADFLPTRLPAEGRVLVVQLSTTAETPHQAGQSMIKYGDPGMITNWPQGSHAYKCEIRNLGPPSALFDIAVTLSVDFREVVRPDQSGNFHAGELIRSGAVSVIAPRLEEKAPFGFWVTNLSPHFATITGISAALTHPKEKGPRLIVNQNLFEIPTFSPNGL